MLKWFVTFVGSHFGKPRGLVGIVLARMMNIVNHKLHNAILNNIQLEENNAVLEIGFGNGYLIHKIFRKKIPISMCGIDISADMLKVATARNRKHIRNNCLTLLKENIAQTSFADNTFDRIITINTIYYWSDLPGCFAEIKRLLKPGGLFLNVLFTKEFLDTMFFTKYGFRKSSIAEITLQTQENGLHVITTIEIEKNKSYCIVAGMRQLEKLP